MIVAKLEPNWENLAKASREIAYQRRAALQQIWITLQSAKSPEEKNDDITMLVKSTGVFLEGESNT